MQIHPIKKTVDRKNDIIQIKIDTEEKNGVRTDKYIFTWVHWYYFSH